MKSIENILVEVTKYSDYRSDDSHIDPDITKTIRTVFEEIDGRKIERLGELISMRGVENPALIEVEVSFRQNWWGDERSASVRIGVRDENGKGHRLVAREEKDAKKMADFLTPPRYWEDGDEVKAATEEDVWLN